MLPLRSTNVNKVLGACAVPGSFAASHADLSVRARDLCRCLFHPLSPFRRFLSLSVWPTVTRGCLRHSPNAVFLRFKGKRLPLQPLSRSVDSTRVRPLLPPPPPLRPRTAIHGAVMATHNGYGGCRARSHPHARWGSAINTLTPRDTLFHSVTLASVPTRYPTLLARRPFSTSTLSFFFQSLSVPPPPVSKSIRRSRTPLLRFCRRRSASSSSRNTVEHRSDSRRNEGNLRGDECRLTDASLSSTMQSHRRVASSGRSDGLIGAPETLRTPRVSQTPGNFLTPVIHTLDFDVSDCFQSLHRPSLSSPLQIFHFKSDSLLLS